MLIKEVLDYIHNYFVKDRFDGDFTIENGSLNLDDKVKNGQYFMIKGSYLNDGIYKYPTEELNDEAFSGQVLGLAIPIDVLNVVAEIDDWQTQNKSAIQSPYQSESFGGYSYTKATSSGGGQQSGQLSWKDVFGHKLNAYRKLI